jgi:hypothetical protein
VRTNLSDPNISTGPNYWGRVTSVCKRSREWWIRVGGLAAHTGMKPLKGVTQGGDLAQHDAIGRMFGVVHHER